MKKMFDARKRRVDPRLRVFFNKVAQFRAAVSLESEIQRCALLMLIILEQLDSLV